MNLLDDKLESLITVCEEKNFTKAGIKLGLTQPAVSNHMKKLEEELGITLFLQKKGDLELTIEGQIVLLYAKRMKALLEKMNQKIIDAKNNLQNLRIGITQTQESGLMLEVLSKMAIEDDKLSITIITDTIKNLYDKLDNFEIDLAINLLIIALIILCLIPIIFLVLPVLNTNSKIKVLLLLTI